MTGLLTNLINGSDHAKCVLLSNQKYMTEPTFINLHPNEYTQELHYYPFAVKLNRYVGSCSTLSHLPNKYVFQTKGKILMHLFLIWLQERF